MQARCRCCGQTVDAPDLDARIELLDLPRRKRQVLQRLQRANGSFVPIEALVFAVYGDDFDGGPDGAEWTIQSHIWHLRKRLAPLGLAIESRRYDGYRLAVVPAEAPRVTYAKSTYPSPGRASA